MWLDPESFRLWMRPSEAELVYLEMDPSPGGGFRFDLREADGRIFVHQGRFLELSRPHRLEFTWSSTVLGGHPSRVTVELHPQGAGCRLVLTHDLPDDDSLYQDHRRGWGRILDRLEAARRT